MALFRIYRYKFSPLQHFFIPTLFDDNQEVEKRKEDVMTRKTMIFDDIFDVTVFSYRNKKYSTQLLFNKENMISFRIANLKTRKVERHFQIEKDTEEPSIVVIIDNRDGIQKIAIEDDSRTFSDPDIVSTIMQNSFCEQLKIHGLQINISREYKETEFWDFVKEHKNSIKMVRFEFDYPNLPVDSSIRNMIKGISIDTHSTKSIIELNSQDGLELSRNNDKLDELNKVSAECGNPIICQIKGFKKHFKTGNTTKTVQFEELNINENSIELLRELFKS